MRYSATSLALSKGDNACHSGMVYPAFDLASCSVNGDTHPRDAVGWIILISTVSSSPVPISFIGVPSIRIPKVIDRVFDVLFGYTGQPTNGECQLVNIAFAGFVCTASGGAVFYPEHINFVLT